VYVPAVLGALLDLLETVTSKVSTGASKSLYQTRPPTVAFSRIRKGKVVKGGVLAVLGASYPALPYPALPYYTLPYRSPAVLGALLDLLDGPRVRPRLHLLRLTTRWSSRVLSNVNLTHAIDFGDLCGAVTSNLDPISSPNETFEAHCVVVIKGGFEARRGSSFTDNTTPAFSSSA